MRQMLHPLAAIFLPATLMWAAGSGRVEKTFDATREPRISLMNLNGHVLVRGWDKAQVHIVYTVASPSVEVDTQILPPTGSADKLHFSTTFWTQLYLAAIKWPTTRWMFPPAPA